MDEIALWQTWGDQRELAVGVVDDKNYYVETAEEVADLIRTALRYVQPEKLWLTPDCGLRNPASTAASVDLPPPEPPSSSRDAGMDAPASIRIVPVLIASVMPTR